MPDQHQLEAETAFGRIVEDISERLPDPPDARPRRQSVLHVGALFVAALALAYAAGRASAHGLRAHPSGSSNAAVVSDSEALTVATTDPSLITYYIVGSQEQADLVRRVLDAGVFEVRASGITDMQADVVVVSTPEEQAAFEHDLEDCATQPDCLATIGDQIDLRPGR